MAGRVSRYVSQHREEILLFTAFVLFTTLFAHVYGWNEQARMDLTRSMVDDRSIAITPYHNNTGDKVLVDGEYYSIKPPVSSLVGIPAYLAAKPYAPDPDGYYTSGTDFWGNQTVRPLVPHTLFHILFILLTAAVPGAILLILIKRQVEHEYGTDVSRLTVVCFGAGTLLFLYSTLAMGVTLAALFGYLSYLFLLRDTTRSNLLISGVFGGLAVATAYYAALVPAVLFLYLLYTEGWSARWYVVGGVAGALPLIIYSAAISGPTPVLFAESPFQSIGESPSNAPVPILLFTAPTAEYTAIPILPNLPFYIGTNAINALKLLFYPVRGFLFYSPLLLAAFAGMYRGRNDERRVKTLFLPAAIFATYLVFNAALTNWFAGSSYGPRYLVLTIPFLALPFARAITDLRWRRVAAVLLPVGMFQNLVGSRGAIVSHGSARAQDIGIDPGHFASSRGAETGIPLDILYPHSWPNYAGQAAELISEGPPMLAVSTLLSDQPWSIRVPAPPLAEHVLWTGEQIAASVSVTWIVFCSAVLLFGAVLWWRMDAGQRPEGLHRLAVLLALVGLLLAPVSLHQDRTTVFLGDGWHVAEGQQEAWLRTSGTILFHQTTDRALVRFDVEPSAQMTGTRLSVDLNGNRVQNVTLDGPTTITVHSAGTDGYNTLTLRSEDGCRIPARSNRTAGETRCLSVWTTNLTQRPVSSVDGPLLLDGWHSSGVLTENGSWMRDTATVHFHADGTERIARLNISRSEVVPSGPLTVSINGERITTREQLTTPMNIPIAPRAGWNQLTLDSEDGCRAPADIAEASSDERCLSFHLRDASFLRPADAPTMLLGAGWYGNTSDRWMARHGEVLFDAGRPGIVNLSLRPQDHLNGSINISLNGEVARTLSAETLPDRVILPFAAAEDGQGRLDIRTDRCVVPADHSASTDTRCLSLDLQRFDIVRSPTEIVATDEWYPEDMWMGDAATLILPGGRTTVPRIVMHAEPELDGRLAIQADGEHIRTLGRQEMGQPVYLTGIEPGSRFSTLRFESTAGCVPSDREGGERCLSFQLENITLLDPGDLPDVRYRDGWYAADDGGRWMGANGEIRFDSRDGRVLNLTMRSAAGLENATLTLRLNDGPNRTVPLPAGESEPTILLDDESRNGTNTLQLWSDDGCVVPARRDGTSTDERCLGVRLTGFDTVPVESIRRSLPTGQAENETSGEGDTRYHIGTTTVRLSDIARQSALRTSTVSEELNIVFYRPAMGDRYLRLLPGERSGGDQWLEIRLNGDLTRNITAGDRPAMTVQHLDAPSGFNLLTITPGCSDTPCNVSLLDAAITESAGQPLTTTLFMEGWYGAESDDSGSWRWMNATSRLAYESQGRELLHLRAAGYDWSSNATVHVILNGRNVAELDLADGTERDIVLTTDPGIAVLRLESTGGCTVPAQETDGSDDDRCLGVRFDELSIGRERYGDGWYDAERSEGQQWRWMGNESEFLFVADDGTANVSLAMRPYDGLADAALNVTHNGRHVRTLTPDGAFTEHVSLNTTEGMNVLALHSTEGCTVPAETGASGDTRCISFRADDISVERRSN